MSLSVFDEAYYLFNNPDVAQAVAQGLFPSGLSHFQSFGIFEGRTSISSVYSESLYLQANPDVAGSVAAGGFSSGLQHFIQFGEAEGRLGAYGLYNEQAYLQANPDVANAVNSGFLKSGFEHFLTFVLPSSSQENRYEALYNEEYYINKYPDVANAVAANAFNSGLQHFLQFGLNEKRTGAALFDEGFYLRDNPDVTNAVAVGVFRSGLEHYARFGEAEGRSGTSFDEQLYRIFEPDVTQAIQAGLFTSGTQHYLRFGQFEDQRLVFFTGTSGSDVVRAFRKDEKDNSFLFGSTSILGVSVRDLNLDAETFSTDSLGINELDVLIGTNGADDFIIGNFTNGQQFYVGDGNQGYALIRNFDIEDDYITLAGQPTNYQQQVLGGSLRISTTSGDLVAIVEGFSETLDVLDILAQGFYYG